MRFNFFFKNTVSWLYFIVVYATVSFLIFDEEPFFDFTDWNIVHIFLLTLSIVIVITENSVKSKFGQFLLKDRLLLFSTFSYWFFLENYVFIVFIGFFFHCLVSLESDSFELVNIYSSLMEFFNSLFLPVFAILSTLAFFLLLINFFLNWFSRRIFLIIVLFLLNILFFVLLFFLLDFLFSSMSSDIFWGNFNEFFNKSKNPISYNNFFMIVDQFDWHNSQSSYFVLRFEDLLIFCFQLTVLLKLLVCVFIFIFYIIDTFFNLLNNRIPSFFF